jgi:hypothetical protein
VNALKLAVVGHVNTGKTSLISTLARRSDLELGDGRTTTRVQEVAFRSGGETFLVLVDTPGFELISEITLELEHARSAETEAGRRADDYELLQAFLKRARDEGRQELELDLRALDAALGADAILYVVDVTQAPLERLRDEVALLVRTARPVVSVLNFTAEARTHEDDWREVFRREKVHAQVAFDVMVADDDAETQLIRTIETVLPQGRRDALERLRNAQAGMSLRHRAAATRAVGELLLDCVTLRGGADKSAPDAEDAARADLQERVRERERKGFAAIGRAHGFSGGEVESGDGTFESELLDLDLFDPETWKREAPGLLGLAAGGAAAGAAVDAMVGGFSLGLGALIGGAAGLVGGFARRVLEVHGRGDRVEAALHPDFAWVLLARALSCHEAYAARTHARRDAARIESDAAPLRKRPGASGAVKLLSRASRDPRLNGTRAPSPKRRAETLSELERALAELLR